MVEVETHVYGIYPKTEDLRKKINRWERGRIDSSEISETLKNEKDIYYNLVKGAKIDVFTDPLFNWYDILRPVALISGAKLGQLTRYKETNTFYRLPEFDEVTGLAIDPAKSSEVESNPPFPLYQGAEAPGFSAFFPSPLTLHRMSQVAESIDRDEFITRITENYLEICSKFGAKKVTIFESFEYVNEDLSFIDRLSSKLDVYLVTEGELSEEPLKTIKNKPYSIVASNRDSFSLAAEYSKVPGIKLIDAHNTRLEKVDELKKQINEAAAGKNASKVVVTNSDYYDFLPRSIADKKVEILSKAGE